MSTGLASARQSACECSDPAQRDSIWSDPSGRVVVSWQQAGPGVACYEMFVRLSVDGRVRTGSSTYRDRASAVGAGKRKARQLVEGDLLDALREMVAGRCGAGKGRAVIALAEAAGIGKR